MYVSATDKSNSDLLTTLKLFENFLEARFGLSLTTDDIASILEDEDAIIVDTNDLKQQTGLNDEQIKALLNEI